MIQLLFMNIEGMGYFGGRVGVSGGELMANYIIWLVTENDKVSVL